MVYLGLPIQNGGSFHGELLNNQMVVQTRTLPNSGDGLLFSIHGGKREWPMYPIWSYGPQGKRIDSSEQFTKAYDYPPKMSINHSKHLKSS